MRGRSAVGGALVFGAALAVNGCNFIFDVEQAELLQPDAGSGTVTASSTGTGTGGKDAGGTGGAGTGGGCAGADTTTDPMNCGTCGHDCLGSTCASSLCQPTVLASGQSSPAGIAADGTNIYWVNEANPGSVMQCTVSNCAGTTITLASNQDYPDAIAVSATTVFWITQTTLMACAVGGCGGNPTQLVAGNPDGIVVHPDGAHILWADSANGTIDMCNTVGASCTGTTTTLVSGLQTPAGLAVDANNVYFSDIKAGVVGKAPLAGGTGTTLAMGLTRPLAIAINAPTVYFVQYLGGSVNSVPIGGGMTSTIATAQSSPASIAVDSQDVYWVDSSMTGLVAKCPLEGCSNGPIDIATGDLPYAVALDEKRVYWVDFGSGTVSWVAK